MATPCINLHPDKEIRQCRRDAENGNQIESFLWKGFLDDRTHEGNVASLC